MSIEDQLAEIKRRGWRLDRLYERENGDWIAGAADRQRFCTATWGSSATDALARLLLTLPDHSSAKADPLTDALA